MIDDKLNPERISVTAAKQRYMHLQNKTHLTASERVEMKTLHEVLQSRYLKESNQ